MYPPTVVCPRPPRPVLSPPSCCGPPHPKLARNSVIESTRAELMYPVVCRCAAGDMCDACWRPPPPMYMSRRVDKDNFELNDADELELVYPEDAAQAACSGSHPRTTIDLASQRVGRLQASTDDSQRRCKTPGCSATLRGSIDRCVQCSLDADEWARRQRAVNMVRTSSLHTTTSVEEKEVVGLLDDVSDAEPPSSSSSSNGNQIRGWDSDLTEFDSDSDSDTDGASVEPNGNTSGLKIHIPLLVTRFPPGTHSKCANKYCNIALPTAHKWKTCDACRRSQRAYQQWRAENLRRQVLGLEPLKPPDTRCDSPAPSRLCSGCLKRRIPPSEEYPYKTCIKCRARGRRKWHRRHGALKSQHVPESVPRVAGYQNRVALLTAFETQLHAFVEGQIMYCRAKMCDHPPSMMFCFAGEYSVVTGQRGEVREDKDADEEGRRDVAGVVKELERVLRASMRPGEVSSVRDGETHMRYTCALELIARLRPLGGTDATPVPLVKTLEGELEAIMVPDESHRLFRGRRTVLSYRMVG